MRYLVQNLKNPCFPLISLVNQRFRARSSWAASFDLLRKSKENKDFWHFWRYLVLDTSQIHEFFMENFKLKYFGTVWSRTCQILWIRIDYCKRKNLSVCTVLVLVCEPLTHEQARRSTCQLTLSNCRQPPKPCAWEVHHQNRCQSDSLWVWWCFMTKQAKFL